MSKLPGRARFNKRQQWILRWNGIIIFNESSISKCLQQRQRQRQFCIYTSVLFLVLLHSIGNAALIAPTLTSGRIFFLFGGIPYIHPRWHWSLTELYKFSIVWVRLALATIRGRGVWFVKSSHRTWCCTTNACPPSTYRTLEWKHFLLSGVRVQPDVLVTSGNYPTPTYI